MFCFILFSENTTNPMNCIEQKKLYGRISVPHVAINQDNTLLRQLPGFDGKQIVAAYLVYHSLNSSIPLNISVWMWMELI